ncbi:MAG: saccharopine dehydrogenase C-terminal domain-containing protein [Bacteroidales bacterium]
MKHILVLGAGLSTASLISYLLKHAATGGWKVTVGDANLQGARAKVGDHPHATAVAFDIFNEADRKRLICGSDLVISMLPARFHPMVAEACLEAGKNMLTASYVSPEIRRLDYQARQKGLLFLNELGVDPGIDHMSAMRVIDRIRERGGRITGFRSFTGGLIAPESDTNPWHYKFTWNPRNVVLAGQGTSMYIRDGQYKYIPYHQLFRQIEQCTVLDMGDFDVYANRDSLKYRELYDLPDILTMFRGTMRRPGYCQAWDVFVQLGITDDSYTIEESEGMTYRQFIDAFLPGTPGLSVEEKLVRFTGITANGEIMDKLTWLGIFGDQIINLRNATPAQILQQILEEKWQLEEDDRDMIIMQHIFDYEIDGKSARHKSSLVVTGRNRSETAMAITVGTPLAIAARLILNGTIRSSGVQIPIVPQLYEPILQELESYGVRFIEEGEL